MDTLRVHKSVECETRPNVSC